MFTETPSIKNDKLCPLCNQKNNCAVSNGDSGKDCWCQSQSFSEGLLEKIPKPLENTSCICQTCAKKAGQLARAPS